MGTMKRVFIIAFLSLIPVLAKADDITYTYTGPAPADLSGSFTVATPLVAGPRVGFAGNAVFTSVPFDSGLNHWSIFVTSTFSFTDGVDVWTPANSTLDGNVFVNPDGSFAVWAFNI